MSKEQSFYILIEPSKPSQDKYHVRKVICPKRKMGRIVLPVAGPTFNLPREEASKVVGQLKEEFEKQGEEFEILEVGTLQEGLEAIRARLESREAQNSLAFKKSQ